MSAPFNIGAEVRLREGVVPNYQSSRVRRYESHVVIGEPWNEPGAYIGDGTDDRYPDWTCIPLVNSHPIAVAMEHGRKKDTGIRAFVKYYGDEAEIAFADVADIEVIPCEVLA
jgi:hypothetical protein